VGRAGDARGAGAGPRPSTVTEKRAGGDGRAPDSWEPVMPEGERTAEQRRLPAAVHLRLPSAVARP
jgi:hypothetical protein